ncbi:MAG: DNA topoisomerase IB, partial [Proteobacteria bacterium]
MPGTDLKAQSALIASLKGIGLTYIHERGPGYSRKRRGKKFQFFDAQGKLISNEKQIERLRKLAIPPAYEQVWICPNPKGHLQFVAVDARGRKQYRYHADWTQLQNGKKFDRMIEFAKRLPKIREATKSHLRKREFTQEKTLGLLVQLLERTLIRIGNDEYARSNQSYGLSTFKKNHLIFDGPTAIFKFKGKSRIKHEIKLKDPLLCRSLKQIKQIPGTSLFKWKDESGKRHGVHSHDVNRYIQEIAGQTFTAKDFRTWAGTLIAAQAIETLAKPKTKAETKRFINQALD